MVGGAVAVVVGTVEEVGRTGRIAVAEVVVVGLGVLERGVDDAVVVKVTDVTAVNVEVEVVASVLVVTGTTGMMGIPDGSVEILGMDVLDGETVTTGWTVVVTVELTMHPSPAHVYPGIQHPPPEEPGQLVSPEGQAATPPSHVWPSPQHPTSPEPVSVMSWQIEPLGQQLLGRLMEAQTFVSPGHWKSRFSRENVFLGDLSRRGWLMGFSTV